LCTLSVYGFKPGHTRQRGSRAWRIYTRSDWRCEDFRSSVEV